MWMMGYNDSTSDEDRINKQQVINHGSGSRRVQRALVPRPPASYNRCHDLFSMRTMNQHHYQYQYQHQHQHQHQHQPQAQVVVSSRWNPTPEQLQRLEELYRGGTRTPSADEIQHITAHLRRFGKIEGKNVFYWFQNHKARERQKRRRLHQPPSTTSFHSNTIQLSEVEETRNWAMPALSEKISMVKGERTRKAADEGWIAVEEGNHDRRRKTAMWNPSSSSSSSSSSDYETLELFPVNGSMEPQEKRLIQTAQHFIEFLPLKK